MSAVHTFAATTDLVSIEIKPAKVLIQSDRGNQFINFDLRLKNTISQTITLSEVEVSIYDQGNHLLGVRRVDTNGTSPSVTTTAISSLESQKIVTLFNPFFSFPSQLKIYKLRYLFSFTDPQGKIHSQSLNVFPTHYLPKNLLRLPLKDRFIVDDGNDFYSHHRRLDIEFPIIKEMGIQGNFSRYAYDLVIVNSDGRSYIGDRSKKENWFGYGVSVYSPADGKVVSVENSLQENSETYAGCQGAFDQKDPALLAGNYIMIDHGGGEFSMMGHLKTGSITVKTGDTVQSGQPLAQLGLSGCSGHVHLHYELRNAPDFKASEGLPSYFEKFKRILGLKTEHVQVGTFNTGDIVEAD